MLEVPPKRPIGPVNLDDVLGSRPHRHPAGLHGRDGPTLEARQHRDPVLVLDGAELVGDLPAGVPDTGLGGDGAFGDELRRRRGHGLDAPGEVLHQVGAVAEEVADHPGAALVAAVTPGQRPLGRAAVVGDQPAPHVGDAPDPAVADELPGALDGGRVAVVETDGGDQPGRLGGLCDLARLRRRDPHWFLDPERFPGGDGGQGDLVVEEVRGADAHHVDLGIGQQLVVVGVGPLEPEGRDGLVAGRRHGVAGGDETHLGPQPLIALRQGAVAARVQPAHPPEADDPHTDPLAHVVLPTSGGRPLRRPTCPNIPRASCCGSFAKPKPRPRQEANRPRWLPCRPGEDG